MHRLKAKLVVEGANIPLTEGAEKYLHDHGVLCIPDFIANSGGVICAAMEYRGKIESEALEVIEENGPQQHAPGSGRVPDQKDHAPGGGHESGRDPGGKGHVLQALVDLLAVSFAAM